MPGGRLLNEAGSRQEGRTWFGELASYVELPTVAHIHEAAAGTTGSIIVPLSKISDNVWAVPAGAKLTDAQYESYKAGNLYCNVHSAAYKSGEIRGQIKP